MPKDKETPLSVRLGRAAWNWLRRESERRTKATGVPIGPSSIVRAIVEREADQADLAGRAEPIAEFRRRWKVDKLGFKLELFEQLRDRSPGRDVRV